MNALPDKHGNEGVPHPGIWRKIWEFPAYPLVAACVLVLNVYVNNQSSFQDTAAIVRPVVFGILAGALLTYGLGLLLRSWHRGGFLAAMLLLALTFGGLAAESVAKIISQTTDFAISPEAPLLAIFAAVAMLSVPKRIPPAVTVAANIWAVFLLLFISAIWGSSWIVIDDGNPTPPDVFAGAKAAKVRPDIYHITLDGYARADVLREQYGFDNTDFLNQVRGFGFAVAERATTPYNQTQLVMLSVFDGAYLHRFGEGESVSALNYGKRIREQFLENSTFTALTRMGYRIGATHSEYPPVDIGRHDMVAPRPWFELTPLERAAFEQSALRLIAHRFDSLDPRESYSVSMMRDAYNVPFTQTLEHPVFLFTHQIAPHPPFNVSRDGGRRKTIRLADRLADATNFHNGEEGLRAEYKEGYVEKLLFINAETTKYLQRLITELPDPKIVIVHGDHGGGLYMDHQNLEKTCAKERFSPLLAVYSSDGLLQARLGNDFNLVNLYRLVFNTYFETGLPMLESKSYFASYTKSSTHFPVGAEDLVKACPASG
jgi:hypothetical protein